MVDATRVPIIFEIRNAEDLVRANKALSKMGLPTGPVAKATKGTQRLGNATQNASYQITDFIVQVEGGVDATRALGQQLPQLLAGFGALGAAVGVVVSLMPAVIRAFNLGEEEIKEYDKAIQDLTESQENYNEAFGRARYAAELDAATKAVRRQIEAVRELSFVQRFLPRFGATGFTAEENRYDLIIENIQEAYGVSEQLAEQIDQLGKEFLNNEITADQYASAINHIALNTDNATTAFYDFATSLRKFIEGPAEDFEEFISQFSGLPTMANQIRSAMQDIEGTPREFVGPPTSRAGGGQDTLSRQEMIEGADLIRGMNMVTDSAKDSTEEVNELFATLETNWDSVVQGIAQGTQSIDDAFKSMAQSVIAELGKIAAKWAATQIVSSLFGAQPAADGMVVQGGVKKFARGGIVSQPTLFPMARGAGLMGEAGPEAIMPLGRNSRGELGVKGGAMNVTINNMAPGVEARTRQDETGLIIDLVMKSMTNAVRQGGNSFADAMENSYALNRGQGVY